MPAVKIPGAESIENVAPARDPGVTASPDDFGAQIGVARANAGTSLSNLGNAATNLGATLNSLSEHLKVKRQAAEDDTYYQTYNVEVAPRLERGELEARKAFPDGGPDYIAASKSIAQSGHDGTIADLAARGITPSENARRRVETNFAGRDMNYRVGAVTYDNNSQVQKLKDATTDNVNATASQVQAGTLSLDDGIKQVGEIVQSGKGFYSGGDLRTLEEKAQKTVVNGEIERLTRTGLVEEATKLRDKWYGHVPAKGEGNAGAVVAVADNLGIKPRDLAAVISYETGGKMDPSQWGGKGSNYLGLIQFGPEERAKYGVRPGMTFAEQMPAVEAYLRDRGVKPGMGVAEIYSIVNTGSLGTNGQPRWDRSDENGTLASHIDKIQREHYPAADKFLTGTNKGEAALLPDPTQSLHWQKQFEAQRTDMVRADALKKIQAKNESDAAEGETRKALSAAFETGKEDPKYSVRAIENDDRMDNAAKERMRIRAEAVYKDEPLAKVSHATSTELLTDMKRQEGDPQRMTNTDPIYAAYKAQKLTRTDFDWLEKKFKEEGGPNGGNMIKDKAKFIADAKGAISIANIGSAMTGGAGTFMQSQFEHYIDQRIDEYRQRKDAPNPANLFDRNHPDYLGKLDSNGRPAILKNFIVDQQQSAREAAASITPAVTDTPANRLKLDEWLRQRGGFQMPAAAAPAPALGVSE